MKWTNWKDSFKDHANDLNNPHNITPEQIGLHHRIWDESILPIETGTWTPVFTNLVNRPWDVTHTAQSGSFLRIGNLCYITVLYRGVVNDASIMDVPIITGLPFADAIGAASIPLTSGYCVFGNSEIIFGHLPTWLVHPHATFIAAHTPNHEAFFLTDGSIFPIGTSVIINLAGCYRI